MPEQVAQSWTPAPTLNASLVRCDVCKAICGRIEAIPVGPKRKHVEIVTVLLASAGHVDRVPPKPGAIVCGSRRGRGGCQVVGRHHVVCSDACERELLERHGKKPELAGLEGADVEQLADAAAEEVAITAAPAEGRDRVRFGLVMRRWLAHVQKDADQRMGDVRGK